MRHLALASLLVCTALPSVAAEPAAIARDYVLNTVKVWAADPAILAAVQEQNIRHAGLAQADIDQMDKDWRAAVGLTHNAAIVGVLTNPAADVLRRQIDAAGGLITEAFVMDALGMNVAASSVTSDYWQGDEAKFTETFPKGAEAVHVGEVEFDESSQSYQIQVSLPLINPADGSLVGAITVALDAEQL